VKPLPFALILGIAGARCGVGAFEAPPIYRGTPYHDRLVQGGPQKIPGKVQCAYFDLGGEGVAYHSLETRNRGSGALNPADGTYLNEFRMNETIGTSYTKFRDGIDDNPYNRVRPPEGQLYVGWTSPGEWFNLTVEAGHAGTYTVDLLYTSNRGGRISLDVNGKAAAAPIEVVSTSDSRDPIAWRQWHHWNVMKNIARVRLPEGVSVLSVHVVTEGAMNLAWLNFSAVQ
jgi:hypothetical protein